MLIDHALKHVEQSKKFVDDGDFDAADFAIAVAVNDLIKVREVINTQLKYSRQGGQK
jgi:flagellin-specific chaperone FliS